MDGRPKAEPFEITGGSGQVLRGESIGSGRDLVLCHGLSATRRYVVHGSLYLPRHGYRVNIYDARGHGESDPGPDGYGYDRLVADLDRVVARVCERSGAERIALVGHSMGCHTVAAWALENPDRVTALVLAGPAWDGREETAADLARWDARADALETAGADGFAEEMARGSAPEDVRERIYRLARDRVTLHRNRLAVVRALREVPRSRPFRSLADLGRITAPALVVGTRDRMDPTHPLATAESWTAAIPGAELAVEEVGEPPLTWQGGRLSREIDRFLSGHRPDGDNL